MGYYSDPYQPCEAHQKQTRKALKILLQRGFSVRILTKSDLVLRDIEILTEMPDSGVSITVSFNDTQTRQLFEAKTLDTEMRIEALRRLKESGIKTSAMICPVIPYVTEVFPLIEKVRNYADVIWVYGLSIINTEDQNWLNIKRILKKHYDDRMKDIELAIFSKEHDYWSKLRNDLNTLKERKKLNLDIHV